MDDTATCEFMTWHRKHHRLDAEYYRGRNVYFITIAIADRKSVFVSDAIVTRHLSVLDRVASKQAFDVLVYCYMPDHVHLLAAGKAETSDLFAFIMDYKQATGYRYKQETGKALWQKSFYDHILRKDEDVQDVAEYILANPVRRQLVVRPADYPYAGSLVYGRTIFESF